MTASNIATLIDQYGDLQAQMAKLELAEKELKKALADVPAGAYESERYRLTLSDSTRETADRELAAELKKVVEEYKAGLSRQYLCSHTSKTEVRTHRIGLPTGKDLAS